jgi:D-sedoheptulose 7-phosphate isomerase
VSAEAVLRKSQESAELSKRFFAEHAAALERCARDLAARFERGGRLFTIGNGGSACDAEHVAVEFAHPIVEKRRALPAHALTHTAALMTAVGNDGDFALVFAEQVGLFGRPEDCVLGLSTSGTSANVNRALKKARALGALTVGFAGRDGGSMPEACDHVFVVPSWSIHRIQEVHTMLLHLLWDEVHLAQGETDVL